VGGRNITFQISDQKAQTWLLFRQGTQLPVPRQRQTLSFGLGSAFRYTLGLDQSDPRDRGEWCPFDDPANKFYVKMSILRYNGRSARH
jgi:hypothetical protein